MAKSRCRKRVNTYFRQTARAFKVARQTQIFSHIRRKIPFTLTRVSKSQFRQGIEALNKKFTSKAGALFLIRKRLKK